MGTWLDRAESLLRAPQTIADEQSSAPHRRWMIGATVLLGGVYGAFMGTFAFRAHGLDGVLQMAATTVKLPALLLLTLGVTMPSLCVFGALANARLRFRDTSRLLFGATAVTAIVAASLGPILGFFTISTTSYPFMVLLNVALLGLAGSVGCAALVRGLRAWSARDATPVEADDATYHRADAALGLVGVWIVLYGVVGAQMGWVLRPFIGSPDLPFALFRATEGNVFQAIVRLISAVVGA